MLEAGMMLGCPRAYPTPNIYILALTSRSYSGYVALTVIFRVTWRDRGGFK